MQRLMAFLFIACSLRVFAADNELSPEERAQGWVLLFDGKSFNGWTTVAGKQSKTPIEDGSINPHGAGDYMMIYDKPLENYVLALDFKISKGCNSGVFIHTFPLAPKPGKDVGWNGIEVAIDDTAPNAGFVDTGAIYDLSKPYKNAMKPVGEWNHMVITCNRNLIEVMLNGELVNVLDLDEWTVQGHRPDGSANKFDDITFKDHPRKGYIGLQDHGSPCWYKNIKIRPLK